MTQGSRAEAAWWKTRQRAAQVLAAEQQKEKQQLRRIYRLRSPLSPSTVSSDQVASLNVRLLRGILGLNQKGNVFHKFGVSREKIKTNKVGISGFKLVGKNKNLSTHQNTHRTDRRFDSRSLSFHRAERHNEKNLSGLADWRATLLVLFCILRAKQLTSIL